MIRRRVSRREFVQDTAVVAAGTALSTSMLGKAKGAEEKADSPDPKKTRSYNENMDYRRLGRTNLMISSVSLGGHWKKVKYRENSQGFKKNRREVVAACLDHGINYVDACVGRETLAYSLALRQLKRRDDMFFGYSWYEHEMRFDGWQDSLAKMKKGLEGGLKRLKFDHVDLWRITMHEQTSRRNTPKQIEIAMQALDWAKKTGKARFIGVSSHDRPWITKAVALYPQLEVVVTPYTVATKMEPDNELVQALKKNDVGMFGIKPFASGSVFKSRGRPDYKYKEEDDLRAREVIRKVLDCEALTTPIPGLVTIDQVKNVCKAIEERRKGIETSQKRYDQLTEEMWANLPPNYQWLRDWV